MKTDAETVVEWVECPSCNKGDAGDPLDLGLAHINTLPETVTWCSLCCNCLDAESLGNLNIRPACLIELWHAARQNRPGFTQPGADVRYVLAREASVPSIGDVMDKIVDDLIVTHKRPSARAIGVLRFRNSFLSDIEKASQQGKAKLEEDKQ